MAAQQSASSVHPAAGDPGPVNHLFYPALDGIRALAFLMVFAQHYLRLSWGWTGVDIFFVLSGFLITGILFDTKDRPHRVWNFYIRRTLRIFPLYYAVFLAVVLAWPLYHWRITWAWLLWPAYLGNFMRFVHPYDPNSGLQLLADAQPLSSTIPWLRLYLGHFWSLCVEEQFYLVWPWLVFWIRDRRRLLWLCGVCIVVTPLLRVAGNNYLPDFMLDGEVLYRATPLRLDSLLLGGFVALLLRGGHGAVLRKAAQWVFVACTTTVVLWLAMNPYARTLQLEDYPDWKFTWGLSLIDLFATALIVLALTPGSWTYRVFSLSPLRWLGRLTYGAYVFHDIPRAIYQHILGSPDGTDQTWVAVLGLSITILLAWLSYRFFESPFIRLKETWTRRA